MNTVGAQQLKEQIQLSFENDNHNQTRGSIQFIEQREVEFSYNQQHLKYMNRFDVKEIYSNYYISKQIIQRSDFIFFLQIFKRGSRHLISIQKSHIFWFVVKLVILTAICYGIFSWIDKKDNILPILKSSYLWGIKLLPFLFILVMSIDPGYVTSHQIYEDQYQTTDDKKRPKNGKYCQHCRIFTKRNTTHCFRCNHCVASYDHHCGILTRCVGKNNLLLFYGFVLLGNILYMGLVILIFYQSVLA